MCSCSKIERWPQVPAFPRLLWVGFYLAESEGSNTYKHSSQSVVLLHFEGCGVEHAKKDQ